MTAGPRISRDLAIRLGAAAITLLSFGGAVGFVAGNVKNPAAPLHPPVLQRVVATPSLGPPGRLGVAPAVRATELPAITLTHVS